jgi:hypothetical protein
MGAPISIIFSEIFLQHTEHRVIYDILTRNHIFGYFRYVDDVLLAYEHEFTDIYLVLKQFNATVPSLTFTIEEKQEEHINFMDITIVRSLKQFTFDIYCKPTTTTNCIIPNDSCHPENIHIMPYSTS